MNIDRWRIWVRLCLGGLIIAFIAIGVAMGLSVWAAVIIAVGAILVNGFIATLEDDLPGGFNNPDGTRTPKYVNAVAWSVRVLGAILIVLIAVILGFWTFG